VSEIDNSGGVDHDDGAERSVLGAMIAHTDVASDVRRTISSEEFYKPVHSIIFQAIIRLDDQMLPLEPTALVSELARTGEIKRVPNGAAYISDLFSDAPSPASVPHYTRIIREASTRRSLFVLGQQMQQMAADKGEMTPSQIVDTYRTRMEELAVTRLGSDVPLIGEVLPLTLEELDKLATEGMIVGVPTGFGELDKALNGLQPGQMIVIAARPGVGKALALDTEIATPSGWTTMGDIQVGDEVFGEDGKPTKVIAVTEIMHDRPCYTVTFSDWSTIVADENHLWTVSINGEANINKTTKELIEVLSGEETCLVPATYKDLSRDIIGVTSMTSVPVKCIDPSHLYLAGKTSIPTHNSSLAMDIARHAAFRQNKAVMVFSLEMGASELVLRMLSAEAYVDMQSLRTGDMDEEKWQKLAKASNKMNNAKLAIDDTATVTMSEIRAKARAFQRVHGLDLIVIDYLQLMNSDNRQESRQQEVSDLSRGVKLLAKEYKVPVIVLSQLNRGSEQRQDKKPVISDLRESGCMTADTRILRADNGTYISFAEMMKNGHENIKVWSLDENRKMVPAKLTNVFSSGVKEVFRLELVSGRSVKASGNHKFLTIEGWVPLSDLKIEMELASIVDDQINESSNIIWDKIVSITPLGEEEVFDATVDGNHNFIAEGIVAHNSIEQDADVVILLHREEMYEKETPRAGEADVIIAKQRSGPTGTVVLSWLGKYARFDNRTIE
jgi:replicative DNA helicase